MIREHTFLSSSQDNFRFLRDQYGYAVSDKRLDPGKPWGDGAIEFYSSKVSLQVQKDRGAFIVLIRPINEPDISEMSLSWILRALSVSERVVLPGEVAPTEYDSVLKINAQLLKTHCVSIVGGDFSSWLSILEFYVKESKKGYFARTGKKIPDRIHQSLEEYIASKKSKGYYP